MVKIKELFNKFERSCKKINGEVKKSGFPDVESKKEGEMSCVIDDRAISLSWEANLPIDATLEDKNDKFGGMVDPVEEVDVWNPIFLKGKWLRVKNDKGSISIRKGD